MDPVSHEHSVPPVQGPRNDPVGIHHCDSRSVPGFDISIDFIFDEGLILID